MRKSSVEIGAAIVFLLVEKPRKLKEIQELLACKPATIRGHLNALYEEGLLFIKAENRAGGEWGKMYHWLPGEGKS